MSNTTEAASLLDQTSNFDTAKLWNISYPIWIPLFLTGLLAILYLHFKVRFRLNRRISWLISQELSFLMQPNDPSFNTKVVLMVILLDLILVAPLVLIITWGSVVTAELQPELVGLTIMFLSLAIVAFFAGYTNWRFGNTWKMTRVTKILFALSVLFLVVIVIMLACMIQPFTYLGFSSVFLSLNMLPMVLIVFYGAPGRTVDFTAFTEAKDPSTLVDLLRTSEDLETESNQSPSDEQDDDGIVEIDDVPQQPEKPPTDETDPSLPKPTTFPGELTPAEKKKRILICYAVALALLITYAIVVQSLTKAGGWLGFANAGAIIILDFCIYILHSAGLIRNPVRTTGILILCRFALILPGVQYWFIGHSIVYFLFAGLLSFGYIRSNIPHEIMEEPNQVKVKKYNIDDDDSDDVDDDFDDDEIDAPKTEEDASKFPTIEYDGPKSSTLKSRGAAWIYLTAAFLCETLLARYVFNADLITVKLSEAGVAQTQDNFGWAALCLSCILPISFATLRKMRNAKFLLVPSVVQWLLFTEIVVVGSGIFLYNLTSSNIILYTSIYLPFILFLAIIGYNQWVRQDYELHRYKQMGADGKPIDAANSANASSSTTAGSSTGNTEENQEESEALVVPVDPSAAGGEHRSYYRKNRRLKLREDLKSADSSKPDAELSLRHVYGYRGHDARSNLFYTNDGRIVYHAAALGIVMDADSKEQQFMKVHNDDITSLAYNKERNIVATGQMGNRPSLVVWDCSTMEVLGSLKFHQRAIPALDFSADGSLVASVGLDDEHSVCLWDWENSKVIGKAEGPKNAAVTCLKMNPKNNKEFISAGVKHISFWNLVGSALIRRKGSFGIGYFTNVTSVEYLESGNVVSGTKDGDILIWNDYKIATKIENAHKSAIFGLRTIPGALITGGKDGMLRVWDEQPTEGKKANKSIKIQAKARKNKRVCVRAIDYVDGKYIVGVRENAIYRVDDDGNTETIVQGHAEGEAWGMATHPQQPNIIATASEDGTVRLWNSEIRQQICYNYPGLPCRSCEFSPDGNTLAVGVRNGSVRIYAVTLESESEGDLKLKKKFQHRKRFIDVLKFNPRGDRLAVGSHDTFVDIYDTEQNYKRVAVCKGSSSYITHIDWSADNKYLMTNTGDYEHVFWHSNGKMQVKEKKMATYDMASWTCTIGEDVMGMWQNTSDMTDINSAERSAQGDTMVMGDDFGKVRLIRFPCPDFPDKKCGYKKYIGHSSHVTQARFSSSQDAVFSLGGGDTCMLEWEYAQDGQVSESKLIEAPQREEIVFAAPEQGSPGENSAPPPRPDEPEFKASEVMDPEELRILQEKNNARKNDKTQRGRYYGGPEPSYEAFFTGKFSKEDYQLIIGNVLLVLLVFFYGLTIALVSSPEYVGWSIAAWIGVFLSTALPLLRWFNTFEKDIITISSGVFSLVLLALWAILMATTTTNTTAAYAAPGYLLFIMFGFAYWKWRDDGYTMTGSVKIVAIVGIILLVVGMILVAALVQPWSVGVAVLVGLIALMTSAYIAIQWVKNKFYLPKKLRGILAIVLILIIGLGLVVGFGWGKAFIGFSVSAGCLWLILVAFAVQKLNMDKNGSVVFQYSNHVFPVYKLDVEQETLEEYNSGALYAYISMFILLMWSIAASLVLSPPFIGLGVMSLDIIILFVFTVYLRRIPAHKFGSVAHVLTKEMLTSSIQKAQASQTNSGKIEIPQRGAGENAGNGPASDADEEQGEIREVISHQEHSRGDHSARRTANQDELKLDLAEDYKDLDVVQLRAVQAKLLAEADALANSIKPDPSAAASTPATAKKTARVTPTTGSSSTAATTTDADKDKDAEADVEAGTSSEDNVEPAGPRGPTGSMVSSASIDALDPEIVEAVNNTPEKKKPKRIALLHQTVLAIDFYVELRQLENARYAAMLQLLVVRRAEYDQASRAQEYKTFLRDIGRPDINEADIELWTASERAEFDRMFDAWKAEQQAKAEDELRKQKEEEEAAERRRLKLLEEDAELRRQQEEEEERLRQQALDELAEEQERLRQEEEEKRRQEEEELRRTLQEMEEEEKEAKLKLFQEEQERLAREAQERREQEAKELEKKLKQEEAKRKKEGADNLDHYYQLKEECTNSGQPYTDSDFPPEQSSLKEANLDTSSIAGWKRIPEISSEAKLFDDTIEPGDIQQGSLGDCWLLSAMSVLTLQREKFDAVFLTKEFNEEGIYALKFFKNGLWRQVIVDDNLPVYEWGAPAFAHGKAGDEFWMAIMEKAYAKMHSSYEAIEGGFVNEGLVDMTGGIADTIPLQTKEGKQDIASGKSWQKLKEYFASNYLMGCGSFSGSDTDTNESGIVQGHAYSILNVVEVDGHKLLQVRNPWGRGEWQGDWSDASPLWTKRMKKKLDYVDEDDGSFWMAWEDFVLNYRIIYVCKSFTNMIEQNLISEWKGKTAGGCFNNSSAGDNPQWLIKVSQPTRVVIVLEQSEKRGTGGDNLCIGVMLIDKGGERAKALYVGEKVAESGYSYSRQVYLEATLKPLDGGYTLLASTFAAGEESDFTINVMSDIPVEVQEL